MFRIWGTGDIVREEEIFDGNTEYTHIESINENDRRVAGNFNRVYRNIFENQKEANDYLTSIANNSDQTRAIYRSSVGQEFDFDAASTDKPVLTLVNSYEITPITTIANTAHVLNSTYFNIYDGDDTRYHVWYDSENTGVDPGAEVTTFTVQFDSDTDDIGGKYFLIYSSAPVTYYVWYDVGDTDSDPTPGGTGIEVDVLIGDTIPQVATKTAAAIDAFGSGLIFDCSPSTNDFIVTNIISGNATDGTIGNLNGAPALFVVSKVQDGASLGIRIEIDIDNGDTADEVKDATVLQLNTQTTMLLSYSTDTDDFSVRTTTPGDPTDTTDGDTGFSFGGITQASTTYGYYIRVTPGVFFYENEILVVKPQTQIAERQLEEILTLQTYLAAPEIATVWYDETNDKFQARISLYNNGGSLTNYDFLNGGVWQTSGGFDTGIELLFDIYSHITFHAAIVDAVGNDLTKFTLEPVVEVSTTETNDFLGFDSNKDLVISSSSLNAANGFDFYQIDYAPTGGSNTVTIDTDLRTFFQNSNDFRQNVYFNVPDTIDGDEDGTENIGSLSYASEDLSNNDVALTFLNQDTGSEDNGIILWDESEEAFDFNKIVRVSDTTTSTTKDTGSIVTEGGLGVEENIFAGGTIKTADTTTSTTKDTGSIVTEGGVGIEENLNVGGTFNVGGNVTSDLIITDTTSSTTKDTGSIVTEGGLGVEENIFAGGTINAATTITVEGKDVMGTLNTTFPSTPIFGQIFYKTDVSTWYLYNDISWVSI